MTVILDWNEGKVLSLVPASKQAVVMTTVRNGAYSDQANQFELMRESLKLAMKDPDQLVELLGEKTLEGKKVVGYRFLSSRRLRPIRSLLNSRCPWVPVPG